MTSPIVKLLPRLEVFNFLEEADYPIIEKYMFSHDYEKGAYVFKEGAHGGYMFFIIDGEVDVIKQFDTQKHTIATLGKGRSVGEMSLIDGAPRSATARAKTAIKLIVLKREDFNNLNLENPAVANKVLMGIASLLSSSLRETNNRFTEKLLSIC
ncbi:MAG: cyclic nucleotide-binding domain-containing protein [Gammaproteobacteria bacterium]|jgi:CRP/FNR family transcriptional regulator, cyclic AMP receptor protein|nr:cyclic nucleotide-binding domain-containing protein [Gammaproteobacteria bacterium]